MSGATADVAMIAATTADSRSVTFDYRIANADVAQPIHFEAYRSATPQFAPGAVALGGVDVLPSGATRDSAGQSATAQGAHRVTMPIPGGLPPDPAQPYVLVVASTGAPGAEVSAPTADFRTYVIGVISHGGLQPSSWTRTGPPWERKMADSLLADGFDSVIPVNWVGVSHTPGSAEMVGPRVASMVLQQAAQFPANSVVDLTFIGHSEGAVVNSQALIRLNQEGLPPNLAAGYITMTMLDPHAANNGVKGPQYSVAEGIIGLIAKTEINDYQSKAHDPPVIVPSNVQDAQVFYQHTPVLKADTNHGEYNLWGQVPVHGQATYFDLTAKGVSHAGKFGVYDWYQHNVVPTLGNPDSFVARDTLTGSRVTTAAETTLPGGRETVTYAGTAAPGSVVRLLAGRSQTKYLKRIGAVVADANGDWQITSRPIAPGTYRVDAISGAPEGPRALPATMRPTVFMGRVAITEAGG